MCTRADNRLRLLGIIEIDPIVVVSASLQEIGLENGEMFPCPAFPSPATPVTVKSFWSSDGEEDNVPKLVG